MEPWSVRVFDLTGKLIAHSWENEVRIIKDLSDLESGIYLIEINVNEVVRTEKIILQ